MKKLFLVPALVSMTFIFLTTAVSVKAQSTNSTSTTVVTKDNATQKPCCKSGTTSSTNCDNSKSTTDTKCDKAKESNCCKSGTTGSNSTGCNMSNSKTNEKSSKRKSCCDAMKNKTSKKKSTVKSE